MGQILNLAHEKETLVLLWGFDWETGFGNYSKVENQRPREQASEEHVSSPSVKLYGERWAENQQNKVISDSTSDKVALKNSNSVYLYRK